MTFNGQEKRKKISDKTDLILSINNLLISPVRFPIMLILFTHKKIRFSELQTLLNLSAGNLDHHLRKLEGAAYIVKKRVLFPKRSQTMIIITELGRNSFKEFSHKLSNILNKVE